MRRFAASFVLLLCTLIIVPAASAHVPIGGGDHESLATAKVISDPTKSWAIYGDLLGGGQAQYYTFTIAQGQRIHLTLLTTTAGEDATFAPSVVLMGPGLASQGVVPSDVQTPAGAAAVVITGARPAQATFEPFGPSAYEQLADYSVAAPATGTYYVAVQAADRGGHYGVAVGDRESFTVAEWALNPFTVLAVYAWERQNVFLVLLPALLTVGVGLGLLARRQQAGRRLDRTGWLAALAGVLFLATGATVLAQMVMSALRAPVDASILATLNFAGLPIILGVLALRLALAQPGRRAPRTRLYLGLLAVGAVVFWAGYLLGPVLAVAAALVPGKAAAKAA